MKLLKIGGLSSPCVSWTDGVDFFEDICFVKFKSVEERRDGFKYIELDDTSDLSVFLKRCVCHFGRRKNTVIIVKVLLVILRIYYSKTIRKITEFEYDEVLVSYNDFDGSAFVFLLVHNALNKGVRITRSYKETRPGYDYLEKMSFKLADRIILNSEDNKKFFKAKYGEKIFECKNVIVGLDEDCPSTHIKNKIKYFDKLSSIDNKKHIVILAGRVFSDSRDERSGSRLFYIDLINEFLEHGFIVHLHTRKIYPDDNGEDQYAVLQKKNKGYFHIENPLDLQGDDWEKAYSLLSRYDYGIIHNFIEGTSNSEFDKYNIAHRYYDYLLAHVIPVIPRGKSIVLEKIIQQNKTGIIYDTLDDIQNYKGDISFEVHTFKDYLNSLYNQVD